MIVDIILGTVLLALVGAHIALAKATGRRTSKQHKSIKHAHHRIDQLEK